MSKELLLRAEVLSNERGVDPDVVLDSIQAALESATRKHFGKDIGVQVIIDRETGGYQTFRYWEVVADEVEVEFPDHQLTLSEAKQRDANVEIGGRITELMESIGTGRIAAQAAKQVILHSLYEAERQLVVKQYEPCVGELMTGTAKRVTRDNVFVDLGGKAEAILPRSEMLPHEMFRIGDRVRAYLYKVQAQPRGPQLSVSRIRPEMLIELFKIEVPEISEEVIEVKSAARDPGHRAKISVKTNDGRIDPIGACVGMRGSRVQAVSSEFGGERIDIILWDGNPAQLVINAMAPAEVTSIIVDEEAHKMDLAVKAEHLAQAIGRNGQNVRLASELTGWTLNVMAEEEFALKGEEESVTIRKLLTQQLGVDEDVAEILVAAGFSSIEEIAYIPKEELLEVEEFDEEIVEELQNQANNILLTKALASEEQLGEKKPAQDLLELEGMDRHLAFMLANKDIITREDLAEQSVDELLELIQSDLDKDRAARLIMKARAVWFKSDE